MPVSPCMFMYDLTSANIQVDANGKATFLRPGDPGWVNIHDDPNYSYRTVIANHQANLELSKTEISPEQYQRMKVLLAHMDRVFGDHGIA